jgi:DNA-binding transcriptional ArsR family regulator
MKFLIVTYMYTKVIFLTLTLFINGGAKRMNLSGRIISYEVRPGRYNLNEELLRILSSHTRVEILRNLRKRQMTLTELANILEFCKSTVHEHLMRLLNAGLVYRITGRKWIYYRLSRKGNYVVGMMG